MDRMVIATGKWIRIAAVHDEAHVEGALVPHLEQFIKELKSWNAKPDIFTFMQHVTDTSPRFNYPMDWDNFAVIPITTYADWLNKRVRKDVKENVRRAKREGVDVRTVEYDDAFVAALKRLYDETPIRQGRAFWHHGKPLEVIREIHGTYRERAEYIGAYFEGELIGFIKMVYNGSIAKTMHVLSNEKYHRKRPTNAMIAKAVEVCEQKGIKYFIYGEYTYPGGVRNSLTEFKRNNGFEEVKYPRYFVPLTLKGQLAVRLKLYRELRTFLPHPVRRVLLDVRSRIYRMRQAGKAPREAAAEN
jgi:hypothetical protein